MSALTEVLEDLCFRFIVNCPSEDLLSFEIELAHWFYEDHYREVDRTLPALSWKEFAKKIFQVCDLLKPYGRDLDEIFERFRLYKSKVPAYGAILLNPAMTHVVLVKGYTSRSSWGFPKGKVNKDEAELQCAQREVYEETSFDITGRATETDYLEAAIHEQRVRLYIVRDVPPDTVFAPRTKKEISKIEWHAIDSLPSAKNSSTHKHANHYYTVIPFVSKLRHWIKQHKRRAPKLPATTAAPAGGSTAAASSSLYVAAPLAVTPFHAMPPMPAPLLRHSSSAESARAQAEAAIKALIRINGERDSAVTHRPKSITVAELFAAVAPQAPTTSSSGGGGAPPHVGAPETHSTATAAAAAALATFPCTDGQSSQQQAHTWEEFSFDRKAIMDALEFT